MPHLTDAILNEYLDDALSLPRRGEMEAHLVACVACQERLAALGSVLVSLAELAALPEAPLEHSLQARVAASLEAPASPPWLTRLAVAQAVTALGLMALAWPGGGLLALAVGLREWAIWGSHWLGSQALVWAQLGAGQSVLVGRALAGLPTGWLGPAWPASSLALLAGAALAAGLAGLRLLLNNKLSHLSNGGSHD